VVVTQPTGAARRPVPAPTTGSTTGSGASSARSAAAEEYLIADVARRYYLQDQTKVQVAAAVGISRFKVARLLEQARATGVVTIHVRLPGGHDEPMSAELATALGLRRCVVVQPSAPGNSSLADQRVAVAAAAGAVLPDLVRAGDRLGLAWSRTVDAMVDRLARLPHCALVQLVGTLHESAGGGTADLVRRAAQLSGGTSHPINAPLFVDSPEAAAALRRQLGIRDTLAMADDLDVAVVAVGAWRPGCSTVWDAVPESVRREGTLAGAVAEVSGRLLGAGGEPVVTALDDMVMGATVSQLRSAAERVALVVGPHRAEATVAAVRAGLVTTLVTTTELAREVLRLPDLPGG